MEAEGISQDSVVVILILLLILCVSYLFLSRPAHNSAASDLEPTTHSKTVPRRLGTGPREAYGEDEASISAADPLPEVSQSSRKALQSEVYTVGLITILDIELAATKAILDEVHEEPLDFDQRPSDDNIYTWGRIGKHNVVLAAFESGVYGVASAATTAMSMVTSIPSLRLGLLIGIGGGVPDPSNGQDIRLGDVAVSNPKGTSGGIVQYDLGKMKTTTFEHIGFLAKPPPVLLKALTILKSNHMAGMSQIGRITADLQRRMSKSDPDFAFQGQENDILFSSAFDHQDRKDCHQCAKVGRKNIVDRSARASQVPHIHYGLIASGNTVMKNGKRREELALALKKKTGGDCICFEMEAAGLMNAFPCLVIRGISDYSDSHKNDAWQKYAAMTAAAYAKELLGVVPARQVQQTTRAIEKLQSNVATLNEHVEELMSGQKYDQIIKWLKPPDLSPNHNKALEQRHKDTGQWFLHSEALSRWISQANSFLWLHGMPGCGKTILASAVIEQLSRTPSVSPILYFYFDFSDADKQSVYSMVRSLISQLYHRCESSRKPLDSLFLSCEKGYIQPNFGTLCKVLQQMMQSAGELWVVQDAMDECQSGGKSGVAQLMSWVKDIMSPQVANLHLLVTSRLEGSIELSLRQWVPESAIIPIQASSVSDDIRSYVRSRIQGQSGLQRWRDNPDAQSEIEAKLTERASGMFRWVVCQLDALEDCLDLPALREALSSLPASLDDTYARILGKIPPTYRHKVIRLLQFLIFSERPIHLGEAIDILAVNTDSKPHFDPRNRMPDPREISHYCSSLVTIVRPGKDQKDAKTSLRLAHFSVKQYLTAGHLVTSYSQFFEESAARSSIVKVCLSYLLHMREDLTVERVRSSLPLAQYCARHWVDHAARAGNHDPTVIETILSFFLSAHGAYKISYQLYSPDQPWDDEPVVLQDEAAPPLYYASLGGLLGTVEALLSRGADVNAQGALYGHALQAASATGHIDIVKLLLDRGADINAEGGFYGNALRAASAKGNQSIVHLLKARGAKADAAISVLAHSEVVTSEDLDTAVSTARRELAATPTNHPDWNDRLGNLAGHLALRHERTGSMDDIESAIHSLEMALDTPRSEQAEQARLRNMFGKCLGRRYERTGMVANLDQAIKEINMAVMLATPATPDQLDYLASLGHWLGKRYELTGSTEDLSGAIHAISRSVDLTPQGRVSLPHRLCSLGQWIGKLYERERAIGDLEMAVSHIQNAIDQADPFEPDRADWLCSLGALLSKLSETRGNVEDLDRAIHLTNIAVWATPSDHAVRGDRLVMLGTRCGERFKRFNSLGNLDQAIKFISLAVNSTPPDHPKRAKVLTHYGHWLCERFKVTESSANLTLAVQSYLEGLNCSSAPLVHRITCGQAAASILLTQSDWKQASLSLKLTIELLPQLNLRSLQQRDKEHRLEEFSGLGSLAAAAALGAGEAPYEALKFLELGQGLIANTLLDIDSDLDELKNMHPHLAAKFLALQRKLHSPSDGTVPYDISDRRSWISGNQSPFAAELHFHRLILEIRALPSFSNFLGPLTEDDLLSAAEKGPVVVVNVCAYRCDAFLIHDSRISTVNLPGLRLTDIQKFGNKKWRDRDNAAMQEWLWDTLAHPILVNLGFNDPVSNQEWPHVWWIPTGLLRRLPLHAAAGKAPGENVLDRVMSSFSLSVTTLLRARQRQPHSFGGIRPGKACLVGGETGLGHPPLPYVERELNMVQLACSRLGLGLLHPMPRKMEVLEALKDCEVFHFAGHGVSSPSQPSLSYLLLSGRRDTRLTTADLYDLKLQSKSSFLAYLSTCSSGFNAADKLLDEGIHMIGAFQFAGFRHVIGTIWDVCDKSSCRIAEVFYQTILKEGATDNSVALGLHEASRTLRGDTYNEYYPMRGQQGIVTSNSPSDFNWALFVHFGV